MQARANWILLIIGVILSASFGLSVYCDTPLIFIIPPFLAAVYFTVFYTEKAFLSLALFAPLSVNIEEYTNDIGLYIPT